MRFDSFSLVYCLSFPVDLFIPQTFIGPITRYTGQLQVGVSVVTAEACGQVEFTGSPAQAALGVQGLWDSSCLEYGESGQI